MAWAERVDCFDWLVTGDWNWLAANVGANDRADVWNDREEALIARVHESAAIEEPAIRGFKEWRNIVVCGTGWCLTHV